MFDVFDFDGVPNDFPRWWRAGFVGDEMGALAIHPIVKEQNVGIDFVGDVALFEIAEGCELIAKLGEFSCRVGTVESPAS